MNWVVFYKLMQPYYLVTLSPWPLLMSLGLFSFFLSVLLMLEEKIFFLLFSNLFLIILIMLQWFRDIVRESCYLGEHTTVVVLGMKLGMVLFIFSEIFFFVSFFWSYFHFSLSPESELGLSWPPMGIKIFDPMGLPFLNTVILLCSGVTLTWSHYSLMVMGNFCSVIGLFLTIYLGVMFIFLQGAEYNHASFSLGDSSYGSVFYMSTGFHGLHVLMGVIFLSVTFYRLCFSQFSNNHHLGFEFACWYWHFVDVVWLFLYLFVYFWIY